MPSLGATALLVAEIAVLGVVGRCQKGVVTNFDHTQVFVLLLGGHVPILVGLALSVGPAGRFGQNVGLRIFLKFF